ncbi:hypothetical protein [Deinococcus pimensis]|uniref:hypothetical protein n=1 Tax=Deinococcus pimensis TaxID=309888 RepID=UPI0004B5FB8D|nr:hypothetical protein [Deinococcus pimensis]
MPRREKQEPAQPKGMLSTHDLKQRGWTPTLIRDFLGAHDATRPNLMRLGSRRRLPPVKLYDEERVRDAESTEDFLVAQGRAMDARDRAEQAQRTRRANLDARMDALVEAFRPALTPVAVRRGARRKAFSAHEDVLNDAVARASAALPNLSRRDLGRLTARLREKYEAALRSAYPWME